MQESRITLNGYDFFYRVKGTGPVVILLHGFGEDGSVWKNQYHLFEEKQLIIPDLPGSGASQITDNLSMEGLAQTILQLLDHLDIQRCTLIGHSMGGYATLAFAENWSNRLNAFGLFHSSSFADSEEKKDTRSKGIKFIRENGAFAFLKTSIPNLFSPVTKEKKNDLVDDLVSQAENFSAEALVRYYEAMMERPDRTTLLKETNLPVLFIMGEHDTAVPLSDSLKQCHLPALSYVTILKQSGHMGMLEEPDICNQSLLQFCNDFAND